MPIEASTIFLKAPIFKGCSVFAIFGIIVASNAIRAELQKLVGRLRPKPLKTRACALWLCRIHASSDSLAASKPSKKAHLAPEPEPGVDCNM